MLEHPWELQGCVVVFEGERLQKSHLGFAAGVERATRGGGGGARSEELREELEERLLRPEAEGELGTSIGEDTIGGTFNGTFDRQSLH
jgi:hypothetical protein